MNSAPFRALSTCPCVVLRPARSEPTRLPTSTRRKRASPLLTAKPSLYSPTSILSPSPSRKTRRLLSRDLYKHPSDPAQCFLCSGHGRKKNRRAHRHRPSLNSQPLLHKTPARLQRSDARRSNPFPASSWSPDLFLSEESSRLARRKFCTHGSSTVSTPIHKLRSRP